MLSGLFLGLYRAKWYRWRRFLRIVVTALEHGEYYSATLRRIFANLAFRSGEFT